jgi:hypothetical protein
VRASFAVPGVFAPVEWDGQTLVDGGLSDNLPLAAARALGARFVVAVDVGQPSDEILSRGPLAVIGRSLDLLQDNAQQDSVAPDVWLVPRLPPTFGGVTFPGDPTPLFEIGYQSVAAGNDSLRFTGRPPRTLPAPPARINRLLIEAPDSALAALARHHLSGIAPGDYAPHRVLKAVDRLYSTGLFEGIWPRVEDAPDGGADLTIRLESPPRFSINAALGYDSDRYGRAWVSLLHGGSVGRTPVIGSLTGLATAREQSASAELRLYPVAVAPLVTSVGAYFREADVRFVRPGDDVEVMRVGAWLSLEAHRLLAERFGAATLRVDYLSTDGRSGWTVGPQLRIYEPQSEQPVVGATALAEAGARWGEFTYQEARARGSLGFRRGKLLAAVLGDAVALWGDAPLDVVPTLGDEHLVPGYRWGEPRGMARAVAGLDLAYPFPGGGYLRARMRGGAVGAALERLDEAPWAVGGEIGLFYRSPFGAVSIGLGANNRTEPRLVLDLGSEF